ncbi:MAG: cbb3-type cytochrome c oxidase subunit I [Planctomycetes bacterium]|nr:cbb3-type cytochrome c oxidase subunit I [Planctomycetota bacterium]
MSHPELSLYNKIFSTDHKVIAKQYMITGLFMALLGGLTAYMFRTELANPGGLERDTYNAMVTMHGTIMVFWVGMPVLLAAFGNLLIPLMIGTEDMAFPRLNMLSYWVFLISAIVLVVSFFVPGGAAGAGWTSYPPLAAETAFSGTNWGTTLWLLAVALEFIAFLMGGINFITTAINMRAPGMGLFRLPIAVWMLVSASIIFMLSVGPLIAGAVMMILDHTVGTGFFNPNVGGDPVLFQHLFWFFGHPEVYVLLLPAFGILAEVICVMSRKTLYGYKIIVYSVFITGVLSFIVWAHHQFIAGIDPRLATPFSITTILISVPVAVTVFCFIATLWRSSIRFNCAMLFATAFLVTFLLGGVTGIVLGAASVDIYFHDSYYVVAHFHYTMFPIVIFAMFAGIYFWYPKMFGRHLSEKLGMAHWIITFIGFNAIFLPLFEVGMLGHHRRIADPEFFNFLGSGEVGERIKFLHKIATHSTYLLLAGQFLFIYNFFVSMWKGKVADANPWDGASMEWQAPSPPPHGNFTEMPVINRGPYEYNSPECSDSDFIPQNAPESDSK